MRRVLGDRIGGMGEMWERVVEGVWGALYLNFPSHSHLTGKGPTPLYVSL